LLGVALIEHKPFMHMIADFKEDDDANNKKYKEIIKEETRVISKRLKPMSIEVNQISSNQENGRQIHVEFLHEL